MTLRDANDGNAGEAVQPRPLVLRVVDNLVIALFFAPVMLSALLLGGVRDWAWAPIAGMIGVVSVLVALGFGAGKGFEVSERERRPLLVLIACFIIFVAFALLQMSSIAPASGSAWLYAAALRILGKAHAAVPDLAVDAARNTLIKCVTCGLIFLMARAICKERDRARMLLKLLVASAVVSVAYGLFMQVTTGGCYVGTYIKKQGEYEVGARCLMSGTFVNSNSFASYVGMAMVAAIALILGTRRHEPAGGYDGRPLQRIEALLSGSRIVLLAIIFFLLGGLLMSASRAGFAASVAGALFLALLLMRGRWRDRPDLVRWFVAAMMIVLVFSVIAGSALLTKALSAGDSSTRIAIWLTSLDAIGLSPWLGWGLGSFADIFTVLQPPVTTQPNNLAHSTPLETVVELGVIVAIPAFAVILLPWGICLRGALKQEYRRRILPAATFAIAAVPILHSVVDFSLQIPAVGYATSALLGMGWAQTFGRRTQAQRAATT
jgi:O-antigen ligase